MCIKQSDLQIQDGFTGDAEEKVSWFDDAGMHWPDRNVQYSFTFDLSKMVALSAEWGQLREQAEIFSQWMHVRPIIVQRATPRIWMPD